MMDLVVVSKNKDTDHLELRFLKGKKTEIVSNLNSAPFAIVLNQPLLLDINGDMISDLLAVSADDGKYYVWRGGNNTQMVDRIPFGGIHSDVLTKPNNPSSNAFIDLNGDGLADIFIDGKTFLSIFFYLRSLS